MNHQQQNIAKGAIKRFGITILCCIPVMLIIGNLLSNLPAVAKVAIFTVLMLVAIAIEEYIHFKLAAKKELKRQVLHKNEDVFK